MDEKSNTPEKAKPGRKPTKIKEVQVQSTESVDVDEVFIPKKRPIREYQVIINGVERYISKPTFQVLSRDPVNYKIEVPKGSGLVEPIVEPQPCKNC